MSKSLTLVFTNTVKDVELPNLDGVTIVPLASYYSKGEYVEIYGAIVESLSENDFRLLDELQSSRTDFSYKLEPI